MKQILKSYPAPHHQVTWEKAGKAIILLQLETGYTCLLKKVALDIWELIDGRRRVSEIVEELSQSYDAKKQRLVKEVSDFILSLEQQQLIRLRPAPQGRPGIGAKGTNKKMAKG